MRVLSGKELEDKCEEMVTTNPPESFEISYSYFKGGALDTYPVLKTGPFNELLTGHIERKVSKATWDKLKSKSASERGAAQKEISDIKNVVPAFVFCKFKQGTTRAAGNIEEYYGLVLDCDKITHKQYEEMIEEIEASGYVAAIYSTFSHDHPQGESVKIRVILPFEQPLRNDNNTSLIKDYKNIYENFVKVHNIARPDAASKSASQCFFVPSYMQLVSEEDMCHTPERFIRYLVGRRCIDSAQYLQTVDNRRHYVYAAMARAWERAFCEKSEEALEKYAAEKIVPTVEDHESFKVGTLPGVAKDIAFKYVYGIRKKKKTAGNRGARAADILNAFKELEPQFFWRTLVHEYTDPVTKQRKTFGENYSPAELVVHLEEKLGEALSFNQIKDWFYQIAEHPDNVRDPFREMLMGLEWDGVSRVAEMFPIDPNTVDIPFRHRILEKWLVSIVVRVLEKDDRKVDTMLVLKGQQGARKSTFFQKLVGLDQYTDAVHECSQQELKDNLMKIRGRVIAEISEIEKMYSKEHSFLKGFVSGATDDNRDPFNRKMVRYKRGCVFVGTTNEDVFLRDETGNRRIWVIPIEGVIPDRPDSWYKQLLAEGVARYRRGETWYFANEEENYVSELNREYLPGDWIADKVEEAIAAGRYPRGRFKTGQFCDGVQGLEVSRHGLKVAKCLKRLGYLKRSHGKDFYYISD
jgi:hypothetical protein